MKAPIWILQDELDKVVGELQNADQGVHYLTEKLEVEMNKVSELTTSKSALELAIAKLAA